MRVVPFLDLQRLHSGIRDELDRAIARVIDETAFVGGKACESFEEAFAAAHGAQAAAGCNSGTDALALALRACGVGAGDDVVIPSMTFVATAEAVCHVGARPVIADVDPDDLLLTTEAVDAARTERTTAVIPVHLYGNPVPFDRLARWREEGLVVIEDAAQAHLATDGGQMVGSVGHAAAFSFYPGKNLGAFGDAGAVVSSDADLVAEVKLLRDHGRTTKYRHDRLGYSSRLDGIQAAVLETKLQYLGEWTALRRGLAARYREAMEAVEGFTLLSWNPGSVHHLMVGRSEDRELLQAGMSDHGVATGVHYPIPMSEQPSLAEFARATPVAEEAARSILSLPMDPLMSAQDVDFVATTIEQVLST